MFTILINCVIFLAASCVCGVVFHVLWIRDGGDALVGSVNYVKAAVSFLSKFSVCLYYTFVMGLIGMIISTIVKNIFASIGFSLVLYVVFDFFAFLSYPFVFAFSNLSITGIQFLVTDNLSLARVSFGSLLFLVAIAAAAYYFYSTINLSRHKKEKTEKSERFFGKILWKHDEKSA